MVHSENTCFLLVPLSELSPRFVVYLVSYNKGIQSTLYGSFLKISEYLVKMEHFNSSTVQNAETYCTASGHSSVVVASGGWLFLNSQVTLKHRM